MVECEHRVSRERAAPEQSGESGLIGCEGATVFCGRLYTHTYIYGGFLWRGFYEISLLTLMLSPFR